LEAGTFLINLNKVDVRSRSHGQVVHALKAAGKVLLMTTVVRHFA
jgi:hypothetical protein